MPLVPPAPGELVAVSGTPVALPEAPGPIPLLDPVPDTPGVAVAVELGLLFAADLSSPQPAIANASATLAAMVSSFVISLTLVVVEDVRESVWPSHTPFVRRKRCAAPAGALRKSVFSRDQFTAGSLISDSAWRLQRSSCRNTATLTRHISVVGPPTLRCAVTLRRGNKVFRR